MKIPLLKQRRLTPTFFVNVALFFRNLVSSSQLHKTVIVL